MAPARDPARPRGNPARGPGSALITAADVSAFERCIESGGVALFPTDTLYGIGCRAGDETALARVYELKGRAPEKPSAEMYFSREAAEPVLSKLGPRTLAAVERLLPGPALVVLPGNEGIRIPRLEGGLEPLGAVRAGVVQTSANLTGGPEPRRVEDVPEALRAGADVVLDGGELPGVASTVVDLRRYETDGSWEVLRQGALPLPELKIALRS